MMLTLDDQPPDVHGLTGDFDFDLKSLIDEWYARRQLTLVGVILRAYPRTRGLTHEWVVLAGALRTIRVRHASLLLPGELDRLAALQARAEAVATR